MFTRDEALALWDDLLAEKDAFLCRHGEMVLCRQRTGRPNEDSNEFGYFVRSVYHIYTPEMVEAYLKVSKAHNCSFRIETENNRTTLLFYKEPPKWKPNL